MFELLIHIIDERIYRSEAVFQREHHGLPDLEGPTPAHISTAPLVPKVS